MTFLSSVASWLLKQVLEWLAEGFFTWWEEKKIKEALKAKDEKLLKLYEGAVNAGETLSRDERRRIALALLNGDLP